MIGVRGVTRIWLVEAILGNALAAWEIYGEQPGNSWHTISYWAYLYQGLGWAIAIAMLALPIWWIWHFHHARVKLQEPLVKVRVEEVGKSLDEAYLEVGAEIKFLDNSGIATAIVTILEIT